MNTITFKHGDCMALLSSVPSKSIDLVIADLPYGITEFKWDNKLNLKDLWAELLRVGKDNAAYLMFGARRFAFELMASNIDMFRYKYIWVKNTPMNFLNANKMPLFKHEEILVFYKSLPTYNVIKSYGHKPYTRSADDHVAPIYERCKVRTATISNGERFPTDILKFPNDIASTRKLGIKPHHTQKPVALLEHLIKSYTREGGIVLDPTAGLGSTAIAAMNTGRNFIGYELDQQYYLDACTRIKHAHGKLFNTQVKLDLGE